MGEDGCGKSREDENGKCEIVWDRVNGSDNLD